MSFFARLVLRTWLPPLLWAIDTPFEPLATGRRRAEPVGDDEITEVTIALLDSHMEAAAIALARCFACGVALVVLLPISGLALDWLLGDPLVALAIALGSSGESYLQVVGLNESAFSVIALLFTISWMVWFIVETVRSMSGPLSVLDNRLILSLKRGAVGPRTLGLLEELPTDSAYRLYLHPLFKRIERARVADAST